MRGGLAELTLRCGLPWVFCSYSPISTTDIPFPPGLRLSGECGLSGTWSGCTDIAVRGVPFAFVLCVDAQPTSS